ncbi:MAG: His/Gly/Thr/Pro-type tRNA ligase C-terminal domain-containing protein [Bacillota bacterium]
MDRSSEKLNFKIRKAQKSRVPYMLVIGDQEIEKNAVNVRVHGGKSSEAMDVEGFKNMLLEKIAKRELG